MYTSTLKEYTIKKYTEELCVNAEYREKQQYTALQNIKTKKFE